MPRVRGFRDPGTIVLHKKNPRQLARLLLSNTLGATTSRISASHLEEVLQQSQTAYLRHVKPWTLRTKNILKSPNDGQIIAIKDNFVTRDLPTTCASHILEGFSAEDATAIELLKKGGMAVVAKTNMDEFGMGSHSTHSAYGAVSVDGTTESLSPGGSSGGSAVAVATNLTDCAIGSDTGGSVRLPAAYTGIVGFKPSYGRISRKGLIPYANSLDTVGILAKNCLDVWLLMSLLAKCDSRDPTCLSALTRMRIEEARKSRVGRNSMFSFVSHGSTIQESFMREGKANRLPPPPKRYSVLTQSFTTPRRIGVPLEYNIQEMHPSVRNAWIRTLSNLQYVGHEIIPISLPSTQQALSAYYVLAPAEASSNLAKYDGVRYGKLRDTDTLDDAGETLYSEYRGQFFGEEVKRRILLGSFTLSAGAIDNYFIQAQKVRRLVQSDFDLVFRMANPLLPNSKSNPEGVDYIICPTAPTPPPMLKEVKKADPLDSYINDVFTVPASLAGLPAISVPAHQEVVQGAGPEMAIGIQVIGQFGDDFGVIHFARKWLERGGSLSKRRRIFEYRPKLK